MFAVKPHIKSLQSFSASSHIEAGIREVWKTYPGIFNKEAWAKVTFPAKDKDFAFQPASFLHILSKIKLKDCLAILWCNIGAQVLSHINTKSIAKGHNLRTIHIIRKIHQGFSKINFLT